MNIKAIALSAVTIFSTLTTSYAATISVSDGDYGTESATLAAGSSVSYILTATQDVIITVTYAVTGLSTAISQVTYGTETGENSFTSYLGMGKLFAAYAAATYYLSEGDSIILGLYSSSKSSVGTTLSYSISADVSDVPLPATGILLVGAIGAIGGVVSRKRSKAVSIQ